MLESIRYESGGGFFLLDAHLARMAASARYFGFRFDERQTRAALDLAVRDAREDLAKVRLLVSCDGQVSVEIHAVAATHTTLRLGLAPAPVDERDPFLFHKTTRRALYDSRRASRPDCDDVILCNSHGELTSATTGNLVIRRGGSLLTPPIEAGVLAGTFREHLLQRGELQVATLRPEDLAAADSLHVINSIRLWRRAALR